MEQVTKLIEAVVDLAWPAILLFVILKFEPGVRSIIESARWRKFTLKVGGQELTMEEINDQQRRLIADLQTQVATLQATAPPENSPGKGEAKAIGDLSPTQRAVLWVDDNPKNNSFIVQTLRDRGINVDVELSTDEGMQRFRSGRYGIIVSDMGREENGRYYPEAGIELLKKVRERDQSIAFIIYCSAKKAHDYRDQAFQYGATDITGSPTRVSAAVLRKLDILEV
jgi:CheY-like chemotaxis protein